MIIAAVLLLVLLIVLLAGRVNVSRQFTREVKKLFALSGTISEKVFTRYELNNLPEPVQRYFIHVLQQNQPYISYARITHSGKFKTGLDKGWVNITGEQYATMDKPGFIWKGNTSMFTARDMYIGNEGRLVVSLFSLITVVDGKGEDYNQGELLRWLGESVLYPTNLLPGRNLQWYPIDASSAKLTFNHNGLSLYFIVSFNEIGLITQLETKRFMDKGKLETWIIKINDYKKLNAVLVPTRFEVIWKLEKADFSYAKFNIQNIEYDIPERF